MIVFCIIAYGCNCIHWLYINKIVSQIQCSYYLLFIVMFKVKQQVTIKNIHLKMQKEQNIQNSHCCNSTYNFKTHKMLACEFVCLEIIC